MVSIRPFDDIARADAHGGTIRQEDVAGTDRHRDASPEAD